MKKADLHIHTTKSDGKLTPSQVVDEAIKNDINVIAITDHDTITGIDEAIERSKFYTNIKVIPGIEFSTIYKDKEIHLLGYFINYKYDKLVDLTNKIKQHRFERAKKIVDKLNDLNINITIDEVVKESQGKNIGRPHIARVMIKKGYINHISEAFDKYIGKNKKAFIERYKLSLKDAIDIIHECNGIAVLAHPILLKIPVKELLDDFNIDGIEVYHSKQTKSDSKMYLKIADNYNLFITGGSDFHHLDNDDNIIIGSSYIDINDIKEILSKYNY
ncbi:PHP domain-containing protein [Senegalia massiliensis]|uniref:PHP domain-containing protein n=1 Tax=Senegalia massiliensis TaxID=1720316 RepID=A0A845QZL8_9CLOT|nr:PHP domain-containing protein [Senegalia massiliensis]NBI07925.1 PHP domain-containing protein [Senegalia massiliensis]